MKDVFTKTLMLGLGKMIQLEKHLIFKHDDQGFGS